MSKLRESLRARYRPLVLLTALTVIVLVLPVFGHDYILYIVVGILILSLFSLSVNLLLGYTGLLSFGQAAFFGVGAFAAAKLLLTFANLPLAMIAGAAAAALAALGLGFICVRHTAIYFAMLTLAFGMLFHAGVQKVEPIISVIAGTEVEQGTWFGGAWGLLDIPRGTIFNFPMDSLVNYYYFTVIITGIAIFLFYRLVHSPLGLTFRGVRDSESRLAYSGISVRNTRLLSFVIAGIYAGLAGALRTGFLGNVDPNVFHWSTSASPVIATLLGGMHTFGGPIVGAAIYYMIQDLVFRYTLVWQLAVGLVIIALVLGLPGGVVGSMEQRFLPKLRAYFFRESGKEIS